MQPAREPQLLSSALEELLGTDSVLSSADELDLHSYDVLPSAAKWRLQGKAPYRPEVVVRPRDEEQVRRLLVWASQHQIPVTPWGLGSSVTGAPLPLRGGICLDMSGMRRILLLDEINLLVKVQAGILGIALERSLNERGYTLNHSPQSLDRSTVGGWVSTRAMGQFSSRYGGIEDLVVALTAVLPTGERVETPLAPRAALGPDLRHVWMGAEGTMGVVTDVTLKIFPLPPFRLLETIRFASVERGITVMRTIMRQGLRPFLVRFYDEVESRHVMRDASFRGCAMFLGFEGVRAVAEAEYEVAREIWQAEGGEVLGPAAAEAWMQRRFDFSTVENLLASPGGLAETIEVAHFWDSILETYTALRSALAPYAEEVLGHFSHVYPQGTSLYIILLGRAANDAEAEARLTTIWDVAMQVCLEQGAALSHHHGVGLVRLPFLREALGGGMAVLERAKRALDPAGIMNPGKLGLE